MLKQERLEKYGLSMEGEPKDLKDGRKEVLLNINLEDRKISPQYAPSAAIENAAIPGVAEPKTLGGQMKAIGRRPAGLDENTESVFTNEELKRFRKSARPCIIINSQRAPEPDSLVGSQMNKQESRLIPASKNRWKDSMRK